MKLSKIKSNPNNPRIIKDDKFKKLVKSINDFPKMLELRPIVVDENFIVQGGNMRLKALQELKYKDIPNEWIKQVSDLTEDQKKEFIIKDNVGFGEWDFDDLANNWDVEKLTEWGLDVPDFEKIDDAEIGEEIIFEQSLQLTPPKEYILIMCEPNSVEWENLKETLKLKIVRRGGYKEGSAFDAVSLERVLLWNDLKLRLNVNSGTE
jgi:hypothetical protein